MMKKDVMISEKELEWLYSLLDVPMTEFDCGELCAAEKGSVPPCCDSLKTVPVLFKAEYQWHRKHGTFWRQLNEDDSVYPDFCNLIDADDYEQFAVCPGVEKCERDKRSLVCRTYPFEPFITEEGALVGLTFNMEEVDVCALISKKGFALNPAYISNSLVYWDFIFQRFPDQFDLYLESSDDLREKVKEGDEIRLFTPENPEGLLL